jgi:hypothetical protein
MEKNVQNENLLGGFYTLSGENITKVSLFFKDISNEEVIDINNNNVDMEEIKKVFTKHTKTSID